VTVILRCKYAGPNSAKACNWARPGMNTMPTSRGCPDPEALWHPVHMHVGKPQCVGQPHHGQALAQPVQQMRRSLGGRAHRPVPSWRVSEASYCKCAQDTFCGPERRRAWVHHLSRTPSFGTDPDKCCQRPYFLPQWNSGRAQGDGVDETEGAQHASGTGFGSCSMALTLSATSHTDLGAHNERVAAAAEVHFESRKRVSDLQQCSEADPGAWCRVFPIQESRTHQSVR
jgi:hypothetical protein